MDLQSSLFVLVIAYVFTDTHSFLSFYVFLIYTYTGAWKANEGGLDIGLVTRKTAILISNSFLMVVFLKAARVDHKHTRRIHVLVLLP